MKFLVIRKQKLKKKKAPNEKGTVFLIALIIIAVHTFSILAHLVKTIIFDFPVKRGGVSFYLILYSRRDTNSTALNAMLNISP